MLLSYDHFLHHTRYEWTWKRQTWCFPNSSVCAWYSSPILTLKILSSSFRGCRPVSPFSVVHMIVHEVAPTQLDCSAVEKLISVAGGHGCDSARSAGVGRCDTAFRGGATEGFGSESQLYPAQPVWWRQSLAPTPTPVRPGSDWQAAHTSYTYLPGSLLAIWSYCRRCGAAAAGYYWCWSREALMFISGVSSTAGCPVSVLMRKSVITRYQCWWSDVWRLAEPGPRSRAWCVAKVLRCNV